MEDKEITVIPTSWVITFDGLFHEQATTITIDDEGAGGFIRVSQDNSEVSFDTDEVDMLIRVLKQAKKVIQTQLGE